MSSPSWLPPTFCLAYDTLARSKCVSNKLIKQGSIIFTEESFANVLLTREKGKRCDACFCLHKQLKKCSGCGLYWYCDAQCQQLHWVLHHKRICRNHNFFVASAPYQALSEHEQLDALLLSHTIARLSLLAVPYHIPSSPTAQVLMSLLPHAPTASTTVPVLPIKPPPPDNLVNEIYTRFGNNNFVVHSHLTAVGHSVFPHSSRLFNHSCVPNAVAKYRFSQGRSVAMDIVALRDIQPEEEIYIPYLDPALSETRGRILQISYGFRCACPSCNFMNPLLPLPSVPTDETGRTELADELRRFAGVRDAGIVSLPTSQLNTLPVGLRCVLREDYLGGLSEEFSRASHEGDYTVALDTGLTLLALYVVIYPPNYPQIGMHLLELTKSGWNAQLSVDMTEDERKMAKQRVGIFLSMSKRILTNYGLEGDEGGPMSEIEVLENLLSEE